MNEPKGAYLLSDSASNGAACFGGLGKRILDFTLRALVFAGLVHGSTEKVAGSVNKGTQDTAETSWAG